MALAIDRLRVRGTKTNDNAAAGYVGQYETAVLAAAGATSLSTGTAKTIASLSLTAGDWDVWGNVGFIPAATTSITLQSASISLTDNTVPAQDDGVRADIATAAQVPGASAGCRIPTGVRRVSIASTTTVYLIGAAVFTVSTMTAYGRIQARRVR